MSQNEIKYSRLFGDPDGMKYILDEDYVFKSKLFNREHILKKGMKSDGATGAIDLGAIDLGGWSWIIPILKRIRIFTKYLNKKRTAAWWVHDDFCNTGQWSDGTPITNFIASTIVAVILYKDGYWLESYLWWFATFLFGGGQARKNGLIWLKKEAKGGRS